MPAMLSTFEYLTLVLERLVPVFGSDASLQGDSVMVNTGRDAEALVIDVVQEVGKGVYYVVHACAWDRTHALSEEHWIADVRLEVLPAVCKTFIDMIQSQEY